MPYKNIVYTKLKCELATDERFTDKIDDAGKLLYFSLLLMAGVKENNVPNDEKYLKRVLNLSFSEAKIRESLDTLLKVFPKLYCKDGFLKFKNYNKLHNPLRNADGTPKVTPKDSQKNAYIKKIIEEYIRIKKYNTVLPSGDKNKPLINHLYKRNCKTAKTLAEIGDKAVEAINWFGGICDKKGLSWTLETILKWYPEYMTRGEQENKYAELFK